MQKIRPTGAAKGAERRDYIHLSGWDGSPFGEVSRRLRTDPAGTCTNCPSATMCSPTPRRSGWESCWRVRSDSSVTRTQARTMFDTGLGIARV